jgi:hypothetical protein
MKDPIGRITQYKRRILALASEMEDFCRVEDSIGPRGYALAIGHLYEAVGELSRIQRIVQGGEINAKGLPHM